MNKFDSRVKQDSTSICRVKSASKILQVHNETSPGTVEEGIGIIPRREYSTNSTTNTHTYSRSLLKLTVNSISWYTQSIELEELHDISVQIFAIEPS